MSIQYAGGTIINATLTQSTGTRAELADFIKNQLVNAGWTSSGSASDYQVTCATTTGGSLAGRVRVYDPGSGNCAKLKFSNTGATKTQAGDLFLLPAVSKVWRIIANKHQFFIFTAGATVREFACGGVPYLPTFLQGVITECIWGHGNAQNDTDATIKNSFRTRLDLGENTGQSPPNNIQIVNGNLWENNNAGVQGVGHQQLVLTSSASYQGAQGGYRWHDDSLHVCEPLIAWGLTTSTDEAKIRGQLWDSVIITDSFAADTTITLDGRTYYAITNNNSGTTGQYARGTLFVAVT